MRPFPEVNKEKWQLSNSGGFDPLWSPNGRELFYRSGDSVMAVAVQTEPTFKCGKPAPLFRGTYVLLNQRDWDISPDGSQFLMLKEAAATGKPVAPEGPRKINIVANWFEELKARVPVNDRQNNLRSYMFAHKGGVHMKYFSLILGLLLLTGFAFAADIDGKWSGTITGMDMPIEFTFKAEGQTLTGSHIVSGTETAIKDGKIDGNNISFLVTLDMGKLVVHKGVLSGDQIKMTYDDGSGQTGEIIVKKAK